MQDSSHPLEETDAPSRRTTNRSAKKKKKTELGGSFARRLSLHSRLRNLRGDFTPHQHQPPPTPVAIIYPLFPSKTIVRRRRENCSCGGADKAERQLPRGQRSPALEQQPASMPFTPSLSSGSTPSTFCRLKWALKTRIDGRRSVSATRTGGPSPRRRETRNAGFNSGNGSEAANLGAFISLAGGWLPAEAERRGKRGSKKSELPSVFLCDGWRATEGGCWWGCKRSQPRSVAQYPPAGQTPAAK